MAFLDEDGLEALWGDVVKFVGEEVDDLESTIDTKAPAIIETASGAIASFDDGADDMPIKKLVANIEPVQDLHGYDSPWPAGGEKNKFQTTATTQTINGITFTVNADGSVALSGTSTGTFTFTVGTFATGENSYILNGCPSGGGDSSYLLRFIADSTYSDTGSGTNLPSNQSGTVVIYIVSGQNMTGKVFYPMIRLATETDATFVPYSNICPISGWTGAEISGTGINIWDEEWELGVYDIHTGAKVNNTSNIRSKNLISVKPNTRYCWVNNITTTVRIVYYDVNKAYLSIVATSWTSPFVFTTPAKACYMAFYFGGTEYTSGFSINYPATDTDYHPYDGNQISVTFPTEAGTVYGGTLTLNPDRTGTLVVNKAEAVYTGDASENWQYRETIAGHWRFLNANGKMIGAAPVSTDGAIMDAISNQYKFISRSGTYYQAEGIGIASVNTTSLYLYDEQFTTVEELTTYLATHNLKVAYPLGEPQTIQLTAEQVSGVLSTIYGTNNIWANTGDTEVAYPADTKLYIDNKITQAIANALNS